MKFIQEERLQALTATLSHATPTESRRIDGRLEVFSTRRTSSEKVAARKLGEKFVTELTQEEEDLAKRRSNRSYSVDEAAAAVVPPSNRFKRPRSNSVDSNNSAAKSRKLYSTFSALGQEWADKGTRKLFTDLILTLNACFADYDFGSVVKPSHFVRHSLKDCMQHVNSKLGDLCRLKHPDLLHTLWEDLDNVVSLRDCQVLEWKPDEDDPSLPELWRLLRGDESNEVAESDDETTSTTEAPPLWTFHYFFINRSTRRFVLFSCIETMVLPQPAFEDDEDEENGKWGMSTGALGGTWNFDMDPSSDQSIPV